MPTKLIPIENFNPSVELLKDIHKPLLKSFCSGQKYPEKGIGEYIWDDAFTDMLSGSGVSYIVFNEFITNNEIHKDVVAFYTLVATSIPYHDRLLDEDGKVNDAICGIPAVEIKVFAVNDQYQDCTFNNRLVAALVFEMVINAIDEMSNGVLGIKAIFLHALDSAVNFYQKCNLSPLENTMVNMQSPDSECQPMYAFIREVIMNNESPEE